MKKSNVIKLNTSAKIDLTCKDKVNSILIIGNFNGMFGDCDNGYFHFNTNMPKEVFNNFMWLNETCKDAKRVFIGTIDSIGDYVENIKSAAERLEININEDNYIEYLVEDDSQIFGILNKVKEEMPKFDYIIQNPPYNKTLHIDFFKKGIEMLNDDGKMTIIEPATWLIDLKDNNSRTTANKLYASFKKELEGHIVSVEIENRNSEFGTGMYVPFSNIYYARCGAQTSQIKFSLCGAQTYVDSIFDTNSIGKRRIIDSILNKTFNYESVSKHSIKRDNVSNNSNHWYIRYRDIITNNGYSSEADRIKIGDKGNEREFYSAYIQPLIHHKDQEIYSYQPKNAKGNLSECIIGSQEELTNYKHYVLNNTLPLFINICMTIDQHNNSLKYVPWLVDKQYTDQEIYDMFKFTQKEINLIEKTVRKFQYSSPFFKRYMCGPSKVSDQEVQEFCDKLDKEFPTE